MAKQLYRKFGSNYSIAGPAQLLGSKSYSIPLVNYENVYNANYKTTSKPTIAGLIAAGLSFYASYLSSNSFHKKVLTAVGTAIAVIDLSIAQFGGTFDEYMYDYLNYMIKHPGTKFHFKYTDWNVNTGTASGWKVQTIYELWVE